MAKQKTAAELRAENRILRQLRTSEGFVSVFNTLIKWGGLLGISYFAYLSIDALAGQTTAADIGIKFLADVKVSEAVAWIFGGSGIAYGLRQRKLRRDTVERVQRRVEGLEKEIDPKRSSSELTRRGETPPEDLT
jgi:hypothetical protein